MACTAGLEPLKVMQAFGSGCACMHARCACSGDAALRASSDYTVENVRSRPSFYRCGLYYVRVGLLTNQILSQTFRGRYYFLAQENRLKPPDPLTSNKRGVRSGDETSVLYHLCFDILESAHSVLTSKVCGFLLCKLFCQLLK